MIQRHTRCFICSRLAPKILATSQVLPSRDAVYPRLIWHTRQFEAVDAGRGNSSYQISFGRAGGKANSSTDIIEHCIDVCAYTKSYNSPMFHVHVCACIVYNPCNTTIQLHYVRCRDHAKRFDCAARPCKDIRTRAKKRFRYFSVAKVLVNFLVSAECRIAAVEPRLLGDTSKFIKLVATCLDRSHSLQVSCHQGHREDEDAPQSARADIVVSKAKRQIHTQPDVLLKMPIDSSMQYPCFTAAFGRNYQGRWSNPLPL
ncbi:hypothetical protein BC835DRAFT_217487 [Cytidiella melzeri]|nr:hypothetical protein BC835DRAFT_217487 [Cytidiella melzeri]